MTLKEKLEQERDKFDRTFPQVYNGSNIFIKPQVENFISESNERAIEAVIEIAEELKGADDHSMRCYDYMDVVEEGDCVCGNLMTKQEAIEKLISKLEEALNQNHDTERT